MTRPEVLNAVFRERPKLMALGMGMLGDAPACERVFQELLVALDQRPGRFSSEEGLKNWCWTALRNRLTNLTERGDGRRVTLSARLLDQLDDQLRLRDGEDLLDQAEALDICLSDLSRGTRWVAHLYYTQDKGGLETSRLVNLKPEHLYQELQKIYAGATKCLAKRVAMGRIPLGRVQTHDPGFEQLVIRYLDDELTDVGVLQLGDALMRDPDRIRQFNDIRLYSALVRDSALMASIDADSFTLRFAPLNPRQARNLLFSLVTACVILGMLLITLALIKPQQHAEAVLVRGVGAQFATRGPPSIGEALNNERYVLTAGAIQVRFRKGADVNIEAPATFRVDSENGMTLEQGAVMALVPPPAEGFEVATKLGTIRDLGTEFGVRVKGGEQALVIVTQGAVEVSGHGESPRRIERGKGVLITPDIIKEVKASDHAYRFVASLPSSDVVSTDESLAINFGFEVGTLSLVPHASHRYRDIPSYWMDGYFDNGKWRMQTELPGQVNSGTVVTPVGGSDDLKPSEGERCLFLKGAAVRQRILDCLPGSHYQLTLKVAAPKADNAFATSFQVGFLAGDRWVVAEESSVDPGSDFTEFKFDLSIPDDSALASKPFFLTLSSKQGLMFFDDVRLKPLFGGS